MAEPGHTADIFLLPAEIFLEIVTHLSIPDILRLRRVCKYLRDLTQKAVVWKRLLSNFHLPLPPLPPTSRYSYSQLTAFEIERLLLRALSADANWRSASPKSYRYWPIRIWSEILEVKVLPGGKHLILSVRNGGNRYEILLLMADHRLRIMYPVATCRVPTRAYKLEAKYMKYKEQVGIMIAYERTEAARERDRNNPQFDVSMYSENHNIDFPVPVRYDLSVMHVKLSSLAAVENPDREHWPGTEEYFNYMKDNAQPFELVTAMRSPVPYDFFDIDEIDGQPFLVCTQQRNITTKNLATKCMSRFACNVLNPLWAGGDDDLPTDPLKLYCIRGIRILPPQRELLVVRTHDLAQIYYPLYAQLYRIPSDGEYPLVLGDAPVPTIEPRSYTPYALDFEFHDVKISPHGLSMPTDLPVPNPHVEPPPLSIFLTSNEDMAVDPSSRHSLQILELVLLPERVSKSAVRNFPPENNDLPPLPIGDLYPKDASPFIFLDGSDTVSAVPHDTRVPLSQTTFRFNVRGRGRVQLYGAGFDAYQDHEVDKSERMGETETKHRLRVVCGAARSLFVASPPHRTVNPRVSWVYSCSFPRVSNPSQWPQDAEDAAAAARERKWVERAMRVRPYTVQRVDRLVPGMMNSGNAKALQAIAWDDWSGAMCLVVEADPELLCVLFFAAAPLEIARSR
ncbi:hypothetical protein FA95DRAFT_1603598 [Auriscalpium vulgare]|uniref:Uncharacterized protein n=1 Tax=Auriscalpium vulgare TaxID=40419 RepID=A0ACB8S1J4_9AGAM|nr:hypothetical protein FA95DRAFT_1603598 [Auriscalpium vulgare]